MYFGKPDVKRISYAASFATLDVVPEYREFVKQELRGIDCISIREKTSLPLLASLGRPDGVAVCDPVFLLDKEQWNNHLPKAKMSEKYLLVYLTDHSAEIESIAKAMAATHDWKIFVVGGLRTKYADKNFYNAGPFDFVRLIRDAQFVVSNSFHATAFSLIMEKEFCVVNRKERINERMRSVLEDYGLLSRLVAEYPLGGWPSIDYSRVSEMLRDFSSTSKHWLETTLRTKKS